MEYRLKGERSRFGWEQQFRRGIGWMEMMKEELWKDKIRPGLEATKVNVIIICKESLVTIIYGYTNLFFLYFVKFPILKSMTNNRDLENCRLNWP